MCGGPEVVVYPLFPQAFAGALGAPDELGLNHSLIKLWISWFHGELDGETRAAYPPAVLTPEPDGIAAGFLIGLLVGEGHFGGDGRQPQVTLRMHVRHEGLFRWIEREFPGGAVYGPYHHGGRSYYQWMARGVYLRSRLLPLLQRHRDLLDSHTAARLDAMRERYAL
jgi:hypothetical protein